MYTSLIHTLGLIDCIVLKRLDDDIFCLLEGSTDWIDSLFHNIHNYSEFSVDNQSVFLDDFIIDANAFWEHCEGGQIRSGIWTESTENGELHLEAIAAKIDEQPLLVLTNVADYYSQQRETLQIARELLISNDEVVERHDYLSERVRSILIQSSDSGIGLPLIHAIKHADIGVIITDDRLEPIELNPMVWQIFDSTKDKNPHKILGILKSLFERQHHDIQDVFSQLREWSGELYWHGPPSPHKWLKVNLNPVFSDAGKVSYWIFTISDITRLKYLLQTNEELTLHDTLTGLPNRQYFWQELQKQVNERQAVSLLSIDIVSFRSINELYGYLEGDDLLNQVVKRISSLLSKNDFMTRVGADEFMILRKHAKNQTAQETEHAILRLSDEICAMAKQSLFTKSNRKCVLPVKIGISHFPLNAINAEELISCAELALNKAKESISKDVIIYSEKLRTDSQRRLFLENELKSAIEKQQLEVHLQAICDLNDQQVIKAEALLRWRLDDELISPVEFIPIAERSDLINIIGRWVFAEVCSIQAEFSKQGIQLPISINFSPKQIYDLHLINFFRQQIEKYEIQPTLLELEVTEGVLINNYNKVKMFLQEIRDIGIRISVDDFGTGYCSLSYLKHLPIDTLKIDRSFIEGINENEDDKAIVSAIIAMAKSLNLTVIAEGVETKEQQSCLTEQKCHIAQGFMYGKPKAIKQFLAQIKNPI
ncbi:putative bifunctional diguanylate cyclase/phosphodiesterase [Agaribacter flavus]|uniref:Bifunctional diguanylate cyclase/phosphodiesterase n=1 Tax=Agaribacter flavus TaxID=1902781 RepID=A0ABV7FSP6_9ALTE